MSFQRKHFFKQTHRRIMIDRYGRKLCKRLIDNKLCKYIDVVDPEHCILDGGHTQTVTESDISGCCFFTDLLGSFRTVKACTEYHTDTTHLFGYGRCHVLQHGRKTVGASGTVNEVEVSSDNVSKTVTYVCVNSCESPTAHTSSGLKLSSGMNVAAIGYRYGKILRYHLHDLLTNGIHHHGAHDITIALDGMGECIETGLHRHGGRHGHGELRIEYCDLGHGVVDGEGKLEIVLGVGYNGTLGELRTGTGGGGCDKKTRGGNMGLCEILKSLALVESQHINCFAHVDCTATAYGDNTVTAVLTGKFRTLIDELGRGIGANLLEIETFDVMLRQRRLDDIGNTGATKTAAVDKHCLFVTAFRNDLTDKTDAAGSGKHLILLNESIIKHFNSLETVPVVNGGHLLIITA